MLKNAYYNIKKNFIFACTLLPSSLSQNPTDRDQIKVAIEHWIGIATDAIGVICVIFIIVGGMQYISSMGNEEAMGKAKNTLTWAIVGLILVLGAKIIINYFESLIKS